MKVIKKVVGRRENKQTGNSHFTNIGVVLEDDDGRQELILNYMPTNSQTRILLLDPDVSDDKTE
tara:strand:+ start:30619 stop:30810 length:192 start_codon:yes stop_codon:yes gene_type:complete